MHDHEAFQSAYLALSGRRIKLLKPWQDANADLISAYERAQRVLRDAGFKSMLDA